MRAWWLFFASSCLLLGMVGCQPKPYQGPATDLHARLGPQAVDIPGPPLAETPGALGPEEPYLPLVWITAHLNESGDLIAGHWVYLMLSPSRWFLRGYQGPQALRLKLPAPRAVETLKEGN